MAGSEPTQNRISSILGSVRSLADRLKGVKRKASDRLANRSDEIRNHPFMQQIRLYANLVGMKPDKIRHVFDRQGTDLFGAILVHPTSFRSGENPLRIGVTGVADPNQDDVVIHKVNLVVGKVKDNDVNAYPSALTDCTFSLPIGITGIYYSPALSVSGPDLAGALHALAAAMRENIRGIFSIYTNARGKQLDLSSDEMNAHLDEMLDHFRMSPKYIDFLTGQLRAAAAKTN